MSLKPILIGAIIGAVAGFFSQKMMAKGGIPSMKSILRTGT